MTKIPQSCSDLQSGEVWGGEEKVVVKVEIKEELNTFTIAQVSFIGMCKPRKPYLEKGRRVYLELRRWKCR